MDSSTLSERLSTDLQNRSTILLTCHCSIEYWGRSRSAIGSGDRLIIMKPDTTIIIHTPTGFKPVKGMSSPTDTSVEEKDGKVIVFSQRTSKPFEEIRITIDEVIGIQSFANLKDQKKITVTHTEADMRDHLAEHPHKVDKGFRLKSKEYKTPVGLLDLYGKIGGKYCVVELKAVKAGLPAVLQLKRYRDWLSESLNQEVVGILMAPGVAKNPMNLLKKEGLSFKKFNVHSLEIKKEKNTLEKWLDDG
jgi:hypothetical protein